MIEDMTDANLTDHFTLWELTKTDRPEFLIKNRELIDDQVKKLTEVARLLEHVRFILGVPLIVHSGYRCPDLNKAIGSKDTSQHILCEAADFTPEGLDLGNAFRLLWRDIKDKGTNVGQLIYETAKRPYGVESWIHISLGKPYRPAEKCAEILRMENGLYSLLA